LLMAHLDFVFALTDTTFLELFETWSQIKIDKNRMPC
jgi:hypothetical protein